MTELILNEMTAKTPIGELLNAADGAIQIRDESGRVLATLVPAEEDDPASRAAAQALTAQDLEEIRRRRNSDRSGDLTTAEFLSHLHALDAE